LVTFSQRLVPPISDGVPTLAEYEATHAGMVQSWSDRFSAQECVLVDQVLRDLYQKDLAHFGPAN
jgi:hypothetical protein